MKILSVLQQSLGFTRNETRVILFLTATFLVGLGLRWYQSDARNSGSTEQKFDYSESDREFLERSKKLEALNRQASNQSARNADTRRETQKPTPQPRSININTASKIELMKLPGVGEAYAERIILYREDHGPFQNIEALVEVQGIGKKTLEKLRPFIRVE
ncbi:MAG: helix-hairpin-helix domain-containing protein [Ignavibacteriae bacterium]|nr:helix-hairpin-helix domain-containing protein [Ignavibacteriota bacterium]